MSVGAIGGWAPGLRRARLAPADSPLVPAFLGLCGFIALAHASAAVDAASTSGAMAGWLAVVSASFALLTWRERHGVTRAALLGTAGVAIALAALWALSRTFGLPGAGAAAPVGPLDAATFLDELLLAVVCLQLRSGPRARRRLTEAGGRTAGGCFVAVGVSMMLLSMGCGVGTAAGASPAGHHSWGAHRGVPLLCHLL